MIPDSPAKYVVSDICDTLFYSNTTFDFVRWCAHKGLLGEKGRRRWKRFLSRGTPLFWTLAVLNKLTGKDFHKHVAVALFAGYREEAVMGWAEEFYTTYLEPRKIDPAFCVLEQFARTHRLILASASIEPVVRAIAAALKADKYVATIPGRKAGKYTGKIERDITGRKLEAITEDLQLKKEDIAVVLSDNSTDHVIMALAGEKYAFCYNEGQQKFWQSLPGVRIIQVDSWKEPAA